MILDQSYETLFTALYVAQAIVTFCVLTLAFIDFAKAYGNPFMFVFAFPLAIICAVFIPVIYCYMVIKSYLDKEYLKDL